MSRQYKYINIEQMKQIEALSLDGTRSQLEIAEKVGCSPATVSRVIQAINGSRGPHIGKRIRNFANILQTREKYAQTQERDTLSLSAKIDAATTKLISLQSTLEAFNDAFQEINSEIQAVTKSVSELTQKL